MIPFRQYLNESFNNPYPYKKRSGGLYLALIPDDKNPMRDLRLNIQFDSEHRDTKTGKTIHEVSFMVNGNVEPGSKSYTVKSASKIFATVISAWKDFNKSNPNSIYLIMPSNKKLSDFYLRMLKRHARGWEISTVFDSKGIARIRIDT